MAQPHEVVLEEAEVKFGQPVLRPPRQHPAGHVEAAVEPTLPVVLPPEDPRRLFYEKLCLDCLAEYAHFDRHRDSKEQVLTLTDTSGQWPEPARMRLAPRVPGEGYLRLLCLPDERQFGFRLVNSRPYLDNISMSLPSGVMFSADIWGWGSPHFSLSPRNLAHPFVNFLATKVGFDNHHAANISSPSTEGFPDMWCIFKDRKLYVNYYRKQGGLEAETHVAVEPGSGVRVECMASGLGWEERCRPVLVSNLEGCRASLFYQVGSGHSIELELTDEQMHWEISDVVRRAIWNPESLSSMIKSVK